MFVLAALKSDTILSRLIRRMPLLTAYMKERGEWRTIKSNHQVFRPDDDDDNDDDAPFRTEHSQMNQCVLVHCGLGDVSYIRGNTKQRMYLRSAISK